MQQPPKIKQRDSKYDALVACVSCAQAIHGIGNECSDAVEKRINDYGPLDTGFVLNDNFAKHCGICNAEFKQPTDVKFRVYQFFKEGS
jgi:hypothetical protein